MAENMNPQSLVSMVSAKGAVNREVTESRFKTTKSDSSSAASRQGGFDGFLNTFLGNDKTASAGGGASSGKVRSGRRGNATGSLAEHLNNAEKASRKSGSGKSGGADKAGSKMAAEDKRALRGSMDKTVEDEAPADAAADAEAAAYSPEVLAAAEEAATLIWNLLYGPMNGDMAGDFDMPGQGLDALRQVADRINTGGVPNGGGLDGMGADGLMDLAALQSAMETANASAEMNGAAVLSALDDLLDGMPRSALEDALSRTADALGLPVADDGDVFNRIAAALEAEVVDVGGGEAELLSFLGGASVHGGAAQGADGEIATEIGTDQNNRPEAAESTGNFAGLSREAKELAGLFQKFVEETSPESPINETGSPSADKGEKIFGSFVEWLQNNNKTKEAKELASDPNRFIQSLANALPQGGTASTASAEKISWVKMNLETVLQNTPTVAANDAPPALDEAETVPLFGKTAGATEQGIHHGAAVQSQPQVPAEARHGAANPASMSTMLDQMENIERLAEAMKMANRNGVKHLTMELSPAELGKVMLRVESKDGVVSAYLRVEKAEAAAQLGGTLDQLREALRRQGIELGELSLQQRGANESLGDFSGQRQGRGQEADDSRGSRPRRGAGAASRETEADAVESVSGNAGPGALNLFA